MVLVKYTAVVLIYLGHENIGRIINLRNNRYHALCGKIAEYFEDLHIDMAMIFYNYGINNS